MPNYDEMSALFKSEAALRKYKDEWDAQGKNPLASAARYKAIDRMVDLKVDSMLYNAVAAAVEEADRMEEAVRKNTSEEDYAEFKRYFSEKKTGSDSSMKAPRCVRECFHKIGAKPNRIAEDPIQIRNVNTEFRRIARHYKQLQNELLREDLEIAAIQQRLIGVKGINYEMSASHGTFNQEAVEQMKLSLIDQQAEAEKTMSELQAHIDYVNEVLANINVSARAWTIMIYIDGMMPAKLASYFGMSTAVLSSSLIKPIYRAVTAVPKPKCFSETPWIPEAFRNDDSE